MGAVCLVVLYADLATPEQEPPAFPPALAAVTALRDLAWSSPRLGALPDLAPLARLARLVLASRGGPLAVPLWQAEAQASPLAGLAALADLTLGNMAAGLPPLGALTALSLDAVMLGACQDAYFAAPALRTVDLKSCLPLGGSWAGPFGWFAGFPALETLDLMGNRLKVVPEGLDALTALTRLDLHCNEIKIPRTCELARLPRLRELDLAENKLLPQGINALRRLSDRLPGLRIKYGYEKYMP